MSEASLSIGRQRVGAFKNARVKKMPLSIRIQWNARTACVSECVLKNASVVRVCVSALLRFRERHGGVEKEGGGKPHEGHPLPKRVLNPPSSGMFSTPLEWQCSALPVQKSTEQARSSSGGVQKLSGGAFSVTFSSPITFGPICVSFQNSKTAKVGFCPPPKKVGVKVGLRVGNESGG